MEAPDYRAEIGSIRVFGGIGSILILVSSILVVAPYAGAVLSIVGIVLVLVALKKLSDITGDGSIFRNALIALILSVLAVVVAFVLIVGMLFSYLTVSVGTPTPTVTHTIGYPAGSPPGYEVRLGPGLFGLVASIIAALAVLWVLLIISSYFLYRSYKSAALHTGVGLFSTAGLLYLIGSFLVIVLVGLVVILVAGILQAVAFFTLPETFKKSGGLGEPASSQPAGS